MSVSPAPATRFIAIGLVVLALVFLCLHRITAAPIEKDPAQITLMAFNLDRHGIISMDDNAPFTASNYREPLPIIAFAGAIKLIDAKLGKADSADAYTHGERVRLLKYQNVLWAVLLCIGGFWAARVLGASFYVALLAGALVTYPYWGQHSQLDDLYTEIPAAAFLMLASATLAQAFIRRSLGLSALAGMLFGLLTLVKAATLYVFVGAVAVVALLYIVRRNVLPLRQAAIELVTLVVAFGIAISPWMYRNYMQMGTWHISQRAGVVLMFRAVDDQMTPEEFRGTFYAFAPQRFQGIMGKMLGFSAADLERGGRLQRLNDGNSEFSAEDLAAERAGTPEKTLSYYRQARAERVKMEKIYFVAGASQPEIAADDALKRKATAIVLDHPWMHLALTASFLWRGATLVFPVMLVTLGLALRRRQYAMLVFGLPAFGTLMLYALLTHFIGRYDLPSLSVAIVVLIVSISLPARVRSPETNTARSFG
jgi:hypothetical protein